MPRVCGFYLHLVAVLMQWTAPTRRHLGAKMVVH